MFSSLKFSCDAISLANEKKVELRGYKFPCPEEQTRIPRLVRVGVIQNSIVRPTTDSILEQKNAILQRMGDILEIAAKCGTNIVCFQEAWSM